MLGWGNLLMRTCPKETTSRWRVSESGLVTGANRGFGRQLSAQLRDRGATVYAPRATGRPWTWPAITPIART